MRLICNTFVDRKGTFNYKETAFGLITTLAIINCYKKLYRFFSQKGSLNVQLLKRALQVRNLSEDHVLLLLLLLLLLLPISFLVSFLMRS